jgi:hypothetical protein
MIVSGDLRYYLLYCYRWSDLAIIVQAKVLLIFAARRGVGARRMFGLPRQAVT